MLIPFRLTSKVDLRAGQHQLPPQQPFYIPPDLPDYTGVANTSGSTLDENTSYIQVTNYYR